MQENNTQGAQPELINGNYYWIRKDSISQYMPAYYLNGNFYLCGDDPGFTPKIYRDYIPLPRPTPAKQADRGKEGVERIIATHAWNAARQRHENYEVNNLLKYSWFTEWWPEFKRDHLPRILSTLDEPPAQPSQPAQQAKEKIKLLDPRTYAKDSVRRELAENKPGRAIKQEAEGAQLFFEKHHLTLTGINAGNYIHAEDFFLFADQLEEKLIEARKDNTRLTAELNQLQEKVKGMFTVEEIRSSWLKTQDEGGDIQIDNFFTTLKSKREERQ